MPHHSPMPAGYTLSHVQGEKSPALREEIVQAWLQAGVLQDREKAEKRVDQVLAIARASDQSLAAIASAYIAPVATLGNLTMFHFRAFTSTDHRRQKLGGHLVTLVREMLEQRFTALDKAQRAEAPAGLYIALENKGMHDNYTYAVLPVSMAAYIGDNAKGQRQYVYYFADARVPLVPLKHAPGAHP